MRAIVLVLMFLAFVKVWTQDRMFRSAAEDALVAAYRDKAVQACQKGAGKAAGEIWSRQASVRLRIGSPEVAVNIWDTDHALWNTRYKHPFLVLSSSAGAQKSLCTYDVTLDSASIARS